MPNKKRYCPGCGRADTMEPYVLHFASSHREGKKCSFCGSLGGGISMRRTTAQNIAQMYDERGPARDALRAKRERDYDAKHGVGSWGRKMQEALDSMFPVGERDAPI